MRSNRSLWPKVFQVLQDFLIIAGSLKAGAAGNMIGLVVSSDKLWDCDDLYEAVL